MKHFVRCMILAFFAGAAALYATDAKEIIEATGIRGGLIVHVGCGDGKLTAALRTSDSCLVQGLDTSSANVAKARARVRTAGLYGNVSISHWSGKRLPYIDNLVNLLIVQADGVDEAEMLRVLAPKGVAYIEKGGHWRKIVKPRPAGMDDWTHYMHDATGNPVSNDTLVAPPACLQWVGGPRWSRHHDHMTSMNAMVSCDGKLFYVFDEGATSSIMLPSKWKLIARDAFNGVILWKRDIPEWWTRFNPLKSGPAQLPRRLVAEPGRVYTTLILRGPVSKLDSATGKTLATYKGTENTWELVVSDGMLCVVTGSARLEEENVAKNLYAKVGRAPGNPINKRWKSWGRELIVIDTASDKTVWSVSSIILPGTLVADETCVYFHNGTSIVALDKKTGKEKWVSAPVGAIDIKKGIPSGFMPSLAVSDGILVFLGGSKYKQHMKGVTDTAVGFSAKTGERLWEAPHYTSGYQSPQDLLIANGTVISPHTTWQAKRDPMLNHVVGTDLRTGKKMFDYVPDVKDPTWFIHHRCYPAKATTNYLLLSKEGVEFMDLKTGKWTINHWIRGACMYGIMPANGLLYAPMHDCACSADMKLNGLNAVAAPTIRADISIDMTRSRLTKGPGYGKYSVTSDQYSVRDGDWPTFRGNPERTGVTPTSVSPKLKTGWSVRIGGKLTAPVVAGGMLFIAAINQHTLYALDEGTGSEVWTFTAEGRIDSPPTIYNGLVLFGSKDGCVYCLRAADGELVWKLRAIAQDRRLVNREQIESVWPVHGSVLVRKGEVWFTAGRSAFLDGGLVVFRVKPETGAVISRGRIDGKGPGGRLLTGAEQANLVGLSDILVACNDEIFMRAGSIDASDAKTQRSLPKDASKRLLMFTNGARFCNPERPPATKTKHLFSSYGLLDDSWFHRSYWVYGVSNHHGPRYFLTARSNPTGRIMVHDKDNVYGFGREQKYFKWTSALEYRLFAESKKSKPAPAPAPRKGKKKRPRKPVVVWQRKVPLLSTGLVLADDTLFTAGAPDVLNEEMPGIREGSPAATKAIRAQDDALAGKRGGILMAVGKTDGSVKRQYKIDAPTVFDGLIAANGSLYMSLKDGSVHRWVKSDKVKLLEAPKKIKPDI